ncbi:MAG: hypothetical protein ACRCXT_02910 [Paraclostridium sp.]
MKNLFESFKNEVGKMLINFGEKLTSEIESTNKRVDKLEKEIEEIKEQFKKESTPVEKVVKTRKVSSIKEATEKDNLNLLKKFTCKEKHRSSNYNLAIAENGEIKTTNFTNTLIIKDNKYNENNIFDLNGSILLKSHADIEDFKMPVWNTESNDNIKVELNKSIMDTIFKALECSHKSNEMMHIHGVLLECKNNILNIVSTDSYRLYKNEFELNSKDFKILINHDLLNCIKMDYNKLGDTVELNIFVSNNIGNSFIELKYSNRLFLSKITDFPFPNYISLIESMNNHEYIEFDNDKKLNEILEYSKNNPKKYNSFFYFNENKVKTAGIELELNFNGTYKNKVGLNVKFLMDMLRVDKKIYMKNSSTMVYAKNEKELSILMPLAFRED